MKFRIRYDTAKTYGFAYETLEAKGIMHAFKLAKVHRNEIRKQTGNRSICIARVDQQREE